MAKNNKRVFLSWQSDLDQETTTNALREALDRALDNRNGWKRDEAARTSSGAPNIASTLEAQIENSEIFIADVSTVKRKLFSRRAFQNPNVLYELGFAVAHLGWERIIMVSRSKNGESHEDLPFDLQKHRTMHFYLKSAKDQKGQDILNKRIKGAVGKIINKNPPKPCEKAKFKSKELQRLKDLEQLRGLLELVNFHAVDRYIEDSPQFISFEYLDGGEAIETKFNSTVWRLYDKDTLKVVEEFVGQWIKTISFGERYNSAGARPYYTLTNNHSVKTSEQFTKDLHAIATAVNNLFDAKQALIDKLEARYPEIDIEETSRIAGKKWEEERAEILSAYDASSE